MRLSDIKKNADAKAAEVEAARKHAQTDEGVGSTSAPQVGL